MQRFQFWKKKARKEPKETLENPHLGKQNGTPESTEETDGTALISDKEGSDNKTDSKATTENPLYDDPIYNSIQGTADPNVDVESAQWGQRDSRLSFETFRGPQSGSDPDSSASHSPDGAKSGSYNSSTRGIPTKVKRQSSFEVIYSQVNKKRSPTENLSISTSDVEISEASDQNSIPDVPKKSIPISNDNQRDNEDGDSLMMSFDDVLASLKLSFTDLVVDNENDKPTLDQTSQTPLDADIPTSAEQEQVPAVARAHEGQSATPSTQDSHPVDIDLMMSDEIIFRARKKSVTFNDVIQERPVSIGESDAKLDQARNRERSLSNGIHDHHTQNNEPNDEKVTNYVISDYQENNTMTANTKHMAVTPGSMENDEMISVTSVDDPESNEEEFLKSEPPKINQLVKTRLVLLVLTWFSLGMMVDLTTCTFPTTQQALDVSTELLSKGHVVHGAGSLLAAIFVAVVCAYWSRDVFILIIIGLVSVSTALIAMPWCTSLYMVYSAYGLIGLGEINVIASTVLYTLTLWDDRKRDIVIHLLFMCQALGSAAVPQISHHLGHIVSNWTTSGLYGNDDIESGLSNGELVIVDNGSYVMEKQVSDILKEIFLLRIPRLVPLYCTVAALGVVCSILLCAVLGFSNIQLIKRRDHDRRVNRLRRKKLKRQIRLANSSEIKPDNAATYKTEVSQHRKCALESNSEIQMLLARIQEVKENDSSNPHIEQQLTKLLAYVTTLHSQKVVGKTVTKPNETKDNQAKDDKWLQGYQHFGIGTQMYLYVFFTIANGLTLVYSQFLFLYAHEHLTLQWGYEDTLILSLYWVSAAISRLIVIPVSKILSANALMITCLVTNMSSSAIMVAYADRYPMLLWLFSGLMGASMGPILPGGFTWANVYYNLKAPKVIGLVFGCWSLGSMVFPWVCGFVVDHWGLPAMFYMTIATAGLAFILYLPILVTLSKRRHANLNTKGIHVLTLPTRTYI